MSDPERILVIRKDNIGDLICTTPMLHQLRARFPKSWIGVLTNRYNSEVLTGNPDVSEVFAYQKAKHRNAGSSRLSVWWDTAKLIWRLRQRKPQVIILASQGGEHFAGWIGAQNILKEKGASGHEVERCSALLAPLGITGIPGPLVLRSKANPASASRILGVHLSARKPSQRWPASAFVEMIRQVLEAGLADKVHLFWAPGKVDDPQHPGDDEKLAEVMSALKDLAVNPIQTLNLRTLIDEIAQCQAFVCSDGGAMHIAAALGKPIVCLFGNSGADQWRPWGVQQVLIQPDRLVVSDVSVEEVVNAIRQVLH
jgi:ADP-heptose:LPS heptosyltransferase